MKKLFLLFVLLTSLLTFAKEVPHGWQTDYEAALARAKQENKAVLVLFTGSDWCKFCKRLFRETFAKGKFKRFARKKLILVYMDNPRRPPLSQEQKAALQKLQAQLKAGEGVPCVVIVDHSGKMLGKIVGYKPQKAYMNALQKIVK